MNLSGRICNIIFFMIEPKSGKDQTSIDETELMKYVLSVFLVIRGYLRQPVNPQHSAGQTG